MSIYLEVSFHFLGRVGKEMRTIFNCVSTATSVEMLGFIT